MKTKINRWKALYNCNKKCKKTFQFSKICKIFRVFFEKAVFLENGRGRHKTVVKLIQNSFISGNLNREALLKVTFKNIDRFQKFKALKSKIIEKVQFHKENGIKKQFSTSKLLKPVNIFEWNFQDAFLIEFPWKWSYFGWAWQLFNACHVHFPKTLLFQKMH